MKSSPTFARGFHRLALAVLSVALSMASVEAQVSPPELPTSTSTVRGNVTGQTEEGQYLGVLANATVEFQKPNGTSVGTATTDENGDYKVDGLAPGNYFYKVSAAGYADDAVGRGITVPDLPADFILNFILPRGTLAEVNMAALSGNVWVETDGERSPGTGTQVFARKTSGGKLFATAAGEDGSFSFELPIGEWRVSALAPGLETQMAPNTFTVGGSTATPVEFVFSSTTTTIEEVAKEVFALTSVQVSGSGGNSSKIPEVSFIEVASGERIAGTVSAVDESEMASLGMGESSFSGNFVWYRAEPTSPLPEGEYEAEGKVEGLPTAFSAKQQVTSDLTTWFDIALIPERQQITGNSESTDTDVPPPTPIPPGIRGIVSGQNDFGEYLGIVKAAKVEILSPGRQVAKVVETNEAGEYELPALGAGNWLYRITAPGFPVEDSGRGFQLAEGSGIQILNFLVTRNVQDMTENGTIRGTVSNEVDGVKTPAAGAMITLRTVSGTSTTIVETDAAGKFEAEVAPANWRASALAGRFETVMHPTTVVVAEGSEHTLEFHFTEASLTTVEASTKDVFALVSVDREGRVKDDTSPPVVNFISESGGARIPATIRLLDDSELAAMGVSTGPGAMRLWDWYEGEPSTDVPVGRYYAEAELADLDPDMSEVREVAAATSTWFDLTLSPEIPELPDDVVDGPVVPMFTSTVSGSVSGQATNGVFEGAIPGSLVEVFSENGRLAGSAVANNAGLYEIATLQPGNYFYRVTGSPYGADDAGRGFTIPADGGSYVQNFILFRDVEDPEPPVPPLPVPTGPGEIFGHVWMESKEGMMPLSNTLIMVRNEHGGLGETLTDEEGLYSLSLLPQNWMISASGPELGNQVHPETVAVTTGSETKVDFVFEADDIPMPDGSEVLIITAVERLPGETGEDPEIFLYREPATEGLDPEEIPLLIEPLGSDPNSSPFLAEMGVAIDEEMEDTGEMEEMVGEWQYFLARAESGFVEPGRYLAAGDLEGYVSDELEARAAHAGLPTIFDLYLEKIRPEVFVKTVDSNGAPLGNVDLKLVNQSAGQTLATATEAETDGTGAGSTVLASGLGEYNLMAMLDGYEPKAETFSANKELVSVTIRMFKEGETKMVDLSATVVEKGAGTDGKKIGSAIVRITPTSGLPAPPSLAQVITTGSTGHFSAAAVPEGSYMVAVAAEGYQEYMGPLQVTFGMEPALIPLDPRNMAGESWIRLILTDGWGKANDTLSFLQKGHLEDNGDCKLDYAAGLSTIRAQDWDNSIKVYRDAVSKFHEDHWWDRACEGYICVLMHREQSSLAASEMRRIVQTHYQDRPANPSGHDAMHMFGAAVGVMNGPWRSDANAQTFAALDRDLIAILKEPLRASYVAGRDSIFDEYTKITNAANDQIEQIKAKAAADKVQMDATVGQRMRQILVELQNNKTQQTALTNAFTIYQQKYQTDSNTYQAQLQQMNVQMQGLQNQLNMIANLPNNCAVCLAEGAEPGCQECLNVQRQKEAQRIAMMRQAAGPRAQYEQVQGLLTNLNNEYRQKDAAYRQQIDALVAAGNALTNEYNGLGKQMAAVPDPSNQVAEAGAAADKKRNKFMTYKEYPIEERKTELLNWVTRKAELPAPGSAPMQPPALPGATGQQQGPPPLPDGATPPPPLPR